jgi:hypothetical protein
MAVSKTESELRRVTRLKPNRGETRQAFLARLATAMTKISNTVWGSLSDRACRWTNDAIQIINRPKIADFPKPRKAKKRNKK